MAFYFQKIAQHWDIMENSFPHLRVDRTDASGPPSIPEIQGLTTKAFIVNRLYLGERKAKGLTGSLGRVGTPSHPNTTLVSALLISDIEHLK